MADALGFILPPLRGSNHIYVLVPGAHAPGYILSPLAGLKTIPLSASQNYPTTNSGWSQFAAQ